TSPPVDVWTPLRPSTQGEGGGSNYGLIGRVRPGYDRHQADAELASLGRDYVADRHFKLPPDALHFHLMSLQRAAAGDRPLGLAQPLIVLWAAVGAILLIGCVNIAGLMLVRGATRQHELATRLALGGGRRSIVGQLLVESSIIAFAGGAGGLAIGYGAL